ncbi:hypothetical protein BLOT_013033 [Blomia tropicalis]|nr:hypothetical protein BLOT_013033 [Blomia tropicalis]
MAVVTKFPISRSIEGSIRLKEFTVDSRLKFDSDGSVKGSRSIKAIKLIEEEQLIFRERLYSVLLLDECRLVKCAYCFHDVANRFLPCKSCNHVVYCSEQCSKYDWNRSHQYDCKIDRFWLNKSKSMGHVFRMLNRIGIRNTLNIIQSAVDDEYDVISYANDTNHLEAYDDDNTENRLKLNQFRAQCKLLSHSDKFGIKYLSYHIGNAIDCVILACLAQQISYSELTRLEIIKLISYCFESVRRVLINSFRWSEENVNNNKMVNVASAYTLIASMFNHSCDPNSEWFIRNGSIYISTKKQVSEGEELTLSYGPNNKCSIKERQTHLLKNYYFLCNCSKCINDSKSVLALQCENCSGPVLIYKEIFEQQKTNNQKCLICLLTMNDTKRKSKQLKQSMRQLELYTKLIPSQQLGIDSEYNWNNCELISKLLNQIGQLIYLKSNLWIEAIYVGCRALFHNGLYDECAQFGSIVDSLLPMSGRELLILETSNISRLLECEENDENDDGKEEQHQLQNDLFDSNIEHLIFWTGVFRVAEQPTYYYQMERFHCRLSSLIDLIIDEKEKTKLNIEDNDILIQSEIDMLRNFQHHKQMEWELFQQEHQTLFE